jgi:hypothetical protein
MTPQNIIKIAVKIGILMKNKQFSKEELANLILFQQRFKIAALTLIRCGVAMYCRAHSILSTASHSVCLRRIYIISPSLGSFYEVDFSEDIEVLTTSAKELGKILNVCHLTRLWSGSLVVNDCYCHEIAVLGPTFLVSSQRQEVLGNHLRDKNLSRIDMVFSYLSANTTWSNTFAHGSPARKMLGEVCSLLSKELERGTF